MEVMNEAPNGSAEPAPVAEAPPTTPTKPRRLLLPRNLAALSLLTAAEHYSSGRYDMRAVHLAYAGEGCWGYLAEATDGKVAGIVRADFPDDPYAHPVLCLGEGLSSKTEAMVKASDWEEAFALPPERHMPEKGTPRPILENVVAFIGETDVAFAATDLERTRHHVAKQAEGKFPDLRTVIPKGEPVVVLRLSIRRLMQLLEVAKAFAPEEGDAIRVEIRKPDTPVVITVDSETCQKFTGLIMPHT